MWAQIGAAALGIWLMAAPAVLGYGGLAATNHRIIGPLVASFAIIAIWEVTRPLRWANVPLGLWLMLGPLLLGYGATAYLNGVAAGALIVGLALVKGKVEQRFGGGWSNIWRDSGFPPDDEQADARGAASEAELKERSVGAAPEHGRAE